MSDEIVELEKITPEDETQLIRPGYPRAAGYPSPNPAGPGYGYGYGEPEQGLHVRELWRTVRKRKYLIGVIAAIVTTLVTIEAYRDKSIYQASATIEIGKDTGTVVKLGDLLLQTDDFNSLIGIKTSMLILKSRPVLEDVVDELHLDKNPKFLDVGSRKSVLEALGALTGRVTGRPQTDTADPALLERSPLPKTTNLERTAEESTRLAPFVGVLDGRLTVDQIKETRALRVSFSHTDPVIAAAVANGVAQDFTQRSFQTKTQRFQTTSDWLSQSTRGLEAKVQEAEQKLADYTKANNIFSTGEKGSLTTDKLSRLFDQANRAETDRMLRESLYA